MLKALRWTTRSLRTHSWPRTQEERQTLEDIIDRKVLPSFPVPLSKHALKRMREERRRQLKAAKESGPPTSADMRVSTPPPPEQSHDDEKDVGSPNSIPQPDSVRPKRWTPTLAQLQVLVAVFQQSTHPSSSLHYELSERLDVPLLSIIRWFSTRRARVGLHSCTRVSTRSSYHTEAFGNRPKNSLSSFTTRGRRISDRPPIQTLDLSKVTASEFVDLSGIQNPYVPVIVGPETLTAKPTYDTIKGRRVAFPEGTTGFFYLHSPADRPAYERSIRFKLVPSINNLDDLHNRSDLLKRDGIPWSIPLCAGDHILRAFIAKAVYDGFITADMHQRFLSLANMPPLVGRGDSVVIHSMSQVFAVPLDRGKITIWVVTDETKIRLNVKTKFLGEYKRQRDSSDAGCALVSIKPHPLNDAPAFVVESVQESKDSPQVKVPTPKYTLLTNVLIERTQYKLARRKRASRT